MPDITGESYSIRVTSSDGQTTRLYVQELAWRGLDSRLWHFSGWPGKEHYISQLLIAYQLVDPAPNGWHISIVELVPGQRKAMSVAKSMNRFPMNATITRQQIAESRRRHLSRQGLGDNRLWNSGNDDMGER